MKIYKPAVSLIMRMAYQTEDSKDPKTEHSIKLCIFYKGEKKYYATNPDLRLTKAAYLEIKKKAKVATKYQEGKAKYDAQLSKARRVLEEMEIEEVPFSFDQFVKRYFNIKDASTEFHSIFKARYQELKADQWKTAQTYHNAYRSLQAYNGKGQLRWADITVSFLRKWQKWMEEGGDDKANKKKVIKPRSKTTIGMYARNIRAIWKIGIREGYVKVANYPFGADDKHYSIPTGSNTPAPLNLQELTAIIGYQPKNRNEEYAKNFWLFSFYGNGINPKDICLLQFKNMTEDRITFIRSKTKRTIKGEPLVGKIFRTPVINEILEMFWNKDQSPENYIFPMLKERYQRYDTKTKKFVKVKSDEMDKRISNLVDQFSNYVNIGMVDVLKALEIKKRVRFYDARDTFASLSNELGISWIEIQEALLHKDFKTTQNYLAKVSDRKKKESVNVILNAINNFGKDNQEVA